MPFGAAALAAVVLSLQPVLVTGDHDLKDAPTPYAPSSAAVYDGQIVSITAKQPGWMQVTRFDGTTGWLPPADATALPACHPTALGTYANGTLYCGWTLAARTDTFNTWDFPRRNTPNRAWRRTGTDRLIAFVERSAGAWHAKHPERKLLIGDLSRPQGGYFGPQYGPPGHASHQNGLDVDVYYPRLDEEDTRDARKPAEVDVPLARELIRRLGRDPDVLTMFVGCARDYESASPKAQRLCNGAHENHVHVRLTGAAAAPVSGPSPPDSPGPERVP